MKHESGAILNRLGGTSLLTAQYLSGIFRFMPEIFDQARADAAFARSEPCIGIVAVEVAAQDGEVLGLEAL